MCDNIENKIIAGIKKNVYCSVIYIHFHLFTNYRKIREGEITKPASNPINQLPITSAPKVKNK